MATIVCKHCPKTFKTETGLAWHHALCTSLPEKTPVLRNPRGDSGALMPLFKKPYRPDFPYLAIRQVWLDCIHGGTTITPSPFPDAMQKA